MVASSHLLPTYPPDAAAATHAHTSTAPPSPSARDEGSRGQGPGPRILSPPPCSLDRRRRRLPFLFPGPSRPIHLTAALPPPPPHRRLQQPLAPEAYATPLLAIRGGSSGGEAVVRGRAWPAGGRGTGGRVALWWCATSGVLRHRFSDRGVPKTKNIRWWPQVHALKRQQSLVNHPVLSILFLCPMPNAMLIAG